jgi:hypothetical protein
VGTPDCENEFEVNTKKSEIPLMILFIFNFLIPPEYELKRLGYPERV